MTTDFSGLTRTSLISTCDKLYADKQRLENIIIRFKAGCKITGKGPVDKNCEMVELVQADLTTAHEEIANLKQLPACLGPYSILQAENERLRDRILAIHNEALSGGDFTIGRMCLQALNLKAKENKP